MSNKHLNKKDVIASFACLPMFLDGKRKVRLSITLDVTLPSHVNFQVTKTFETVKEKLIKTVHILLLLSFYIH